MELSRHHHVIATVTAYPAVTIEMSAVRKVYKGFHFTPAGSSSFISVVLCIVGQQCPSSHLKC